MVGPGIIVLGTGWLIGGSVPYLFEYQKQELII